MHGDRGYQEADAQKNERNRIADEVPQERASDPETAAVVFLDPQSGGPFAGGETGQAGNDAEIEYGHRDGHQNAGSLGGTARGARTATQHARDQSAHDEQRDEYDVID